ncbi:glutathione S-transferase C-terminal domain-containing protein, partial [Mycobacterium tuberculosis]|nr:glutathione S-transferase C-terminal domain-containing protein [Mycobacterium tuberculosis]
LFAMLDDELAKRPGLSGEQFGLGDFAVAPFLYNLLSILDSWQPRPHLQRWYQQISQRPAWREVVQIPVT